MIGHLTGWTCTALLLAQASAINQAPSFRAETRLTVLYATVTDARGELVTNLDRDAFTVFDHGAAQPIALFRRDDVPVSIGLVIDNSGSMRPRRVDVEAAALAFVRASNPDDESFVLNFADHWRIDVPMTSDVSTIEAGIARVDAIGGTALRDAVEAADSYLTTHARWQRRVLLVVSDGNDNGSATTLDELRHAMENTGTAIYAIGLSGGGNAGSGPADLRHLSESTGGVVAFPVDDTQLTSTATNLARQIRMQYTIGYVPRVGARDDVRRIHVTVRGSDRYTVRTRIGYQARP